MSELSFNLSYFERDCCTLSSPNDPPWGRYRLCSDVITRTVLDNMDRTFFTYMKDFSTWELEGIFVNHDQGYGSVVYTLTITDKRAFNVFKLKAGIYLRKVFENGVKNYEYNETDSWSDFQRWISAETIFNEDY